MADFIMAFVLGGLLRILKDTKKPDSPSGLSGFYDFNKMNDWF
jgi:hypothetical protein